MQGPHWNFAFCVDGIPFQGHQVRHSVTSKVIFKAYRNKTKLPQKFSFEIAIVKLKNPKLKITLN